MLRLSSLLPFRTLTIHTTLSPSEVEERLQRDVSERSLRSFFSFGASRAYVGEVASGSFEIRRAITYRNSFLPMVLGEIIPMPSGSRVEVTMRPMVFVLAFMCVWLTFTLVGFVGILFKAGLLASLGALGMFAFGVVLCTGAFGFEAAKAERFLRDSLGAVEVGAVEVGAVEVSAA